MIYGVSDTAKRLIMPEVRGKKFSPSNFAQELADSFRTLQINSEKNPLNFNPSF